jgi:hypothetical protein
MSFSAMDKKIFSLSVIVLLLISGCKKENMCDCIKRTGDIITDTRYPGVFDKIVVEDNLVVYLAQDSICEVKVEAGDNIVPLIRTEVEGRTLRIRNDNRCNWTRSYKKPMNVYVKMPKVDYVTMEGTGKVIGQNILTYPLEVETKNSGDIELSVNTSKVISHMFGYGDITLRGTATQHYCSIGGDGFLHASELETEYTWLDAFTSGLTYIRVTGLLQVKIKKAGDVYCYGNPDTVEKTLIGSGQLYLQ